MITRETLRDFAELIIMNHDYEGIEALLYADGVYLIRQNGSMGRDESQIMVKIPLGQAYWGDSCIWGKDLDEDKDLAESAIGDLIEDILFRIDCWKIEKGGAEHENIKR